MTREVIQRLESINIHLDISEDAVRLIAKEGIDLEYGARPLKELFKRIRRYFIRSNFKRWRKRRSNIIAVIENNKIVYKYKICMNHIKLRWGGNSSS